MTRNVWLGCELRQPPCTTKPGVQNPRQRSEEEEGEEEEEEEEEGEEEEEEE